MRRGCMPGDFMTHYAVVSRGETAAVMTPRAMSLYPIPYMRARRSLVVATHAVILLVTGEAALPVPFGHEPVAERAPGVRMVTRHPRVVTGNAVVPLMAGKTGLPALSRLVDVQVCRCAVKFDPIPFVGFRPWKRYFPLEGPGGFRLDRRGVSGVSRFYSRVAAHKANRRQREAGH